MTLTQALLVAVATETACIIFLFGILMSKNKTQDKRLSDCEIDRAKLQEKYESQQKELTKVWEWLAKGHVLKDKGET